jgi:D-alanyl-D-alanine carboxypeptidase
MWKLKTFRDFLLRFPKLDRSRQLLAISCILLAILYPGQNSLQKIVINPGIVHSYSLPQITPELYPLHDGVKVPYVSARAVVIQDKGSKTILYSKNPDMLTLPASITKVMTALVALDHWSDLNTVITVKNEDRAIGQTIDLVKGESITLKNILYGLIVHSGNDAALAVAENYPGGYTAFVKAMNDKASDLHLDHTTFKNPSGVEQYGHTTTARDLAILAGVAMNNQVIADMANTRLITLTDVTGTIFHGLETTNELLGVVPGLIGLKTGWTTNAGECLLSVVERDGHKVVVVVLGSLDRFGDSTDLINWTYTHHKWITPEL